VENGQQRLADDEAQLGKLLPMFQFWQMLTCTGIVLVFTAAIGVPGNKFSEMWTPPTSFGEMAVFVARIVLFVELVLLAYQWVKATHEELEMWLQALDLRQKPGDAYSAMGALSLLLGLLMAFPHHIVFITGLFTTSLLVNYWTQWICNRTFAQELQEARKKFARSRWRMEVLDIMEHYWLTLPQLARIVTMMFFSSIAFSLALAGALQPEPQKSRLQLAAYVLLIGDILVSEVIIAIWRHKLARVEEALQSNGKSKGKLGNHPWIKHADIQS
jgi:hypothetical protein